MLSCIAQLESMDKYTLGRDLLNACSTGLCLPFHVIKIFRFLSFQAWHPSKAPDAARMILSYALREHNSNLSDTNPTSSRPVRSTVRQMRNLEQKKAVFLENEFSDGNGPVFMWKYFPGRFTEIPSMSWYDVRGRQCPSNLSNVMFFSRS